VIGSQFVENTDSADSSEKNAIAANANQFNAQPPAAFAWRIEQVSQADSKSLPLDQPIVTTDEPVEIHLGGLHRIVLAKQTKLTVHPNRNDSTGYAYNIHIAQGKALFEVACSPNPDPV